MKKSPLCSSLPVATAAAAIAGGLVLPMPAFGQSAADRSLSDVRVENVGSCTTLTINFNVRVQMLSHFPLEAGREVHIRVQPLDAGALGLLKESLRPPSSVPELRSIDYEGNNPSGPVLSLFFAKNMKFDVAAGRDPHSIVIRLSQPGAGAICSAQATAAPTLPKPGTTVGIPQGLYVVNVASLPQAIGELSSEQKSALRATVLYETTFERDSQQWHRLRAGFYETRAEAEAARTQLAKAFPDAFVVKVSADEREQGAANRIETGGQAATQPPPTGSGSAEDTAETGRLIGEAEAAITEGNNDRAIQLLTNALARSENENSPRALELLGLTRERKGQTTHAEAEYQEFLRRYQTGEASDRVRQRLAALKGAGSPGQTLRAASSQTAGASTWTWGLRGSFSQFYYRDQSSTKFIDSSRPEINAEPTDSVNLNQLLSAGDVTISGGNDQRQFQLRAAGSYSRDFRKPSRKVLDANEDPVIDPDTGLDLLVRNHIKTLTALYLDYTDSQANVSALFSRQTLNSAAVLGRFDCLLLARHECPDLRFNAVGGFPVLTSRQTYVLKDRRFYGVSMDIGTRRSPVQGTVYWFDQRARSGFVDRQSIGLEARVLLPRFNSYTIIDYDVKHRQLNLGLLTMNYNFPDSSNLTLTADYRQSPLLTTNNALLQQFYILNNKRVRALGDLRPFFLDDQIYQLARDRTQTVQSATISYSRPLSSKLQASVDFTLTNTGGMPLTPASAGTRQVDAVAGTGNEYYVGGQLVGSGLIWGNDIYIVSGRYSETQMSRSWTADFNARVPVTSKLRLSPRLRYGYRTSKVIDSTYRQFQPTMRLNYYPRRNAEFELEMGGNFNRQRDNVAAVITRTNESGFLVSAGYRIDF